MKKFKLRISGGFVLAMALFWFFDVEGSLFSALVCALVHELGHLSVLLLLGGKVRHINAAILGLCISYTGIYSKVKECLVVISGPLANIAFAILCFYSGCKTTAAISLVQCVFNLLPISEMDGGRLLSMIVPNLRLCRLVDGAAIALICTVAAFALYHGQISGICLLAAWLIFDRVLAKARIKSYNK